jgi:cbb3-type cytochrome oxidase cytochrome c subunit
MMNNGAVLFLGILLSLAGSFWGLLVAPQLQIGRQQVRVLEGSGELYPTLRPGQAQRGAQVYVAQGCAECHTRQVRQTGVQLDVRITDLGTNLPAVVKAYGETPLGGDEDLDSKYLRKNLPASVGTNSTAAAAQKLITRFTAAGATAVPVLLALGPDIQRGWGVRLSVAQDYLQDYPVQLGKLRLGPDLSNYGGRQTNAAAIIERLRNPQAAVPDSWMPSYRFLSNEDIQALASYLISLRANTPLFEGPVTKPPAAPGAAAPATNAAANVVK